jgi:5,10-methylenetetrahydromethanopterin reductase
LGSALATIHELSGGRAFIGMGSGWIGLTFLGIPPMNPRETIEYGIAARAFAAGEEVKWEGATIQAHWTPGPVPLWVAAEGRRILELSGQHADGVLVGNSPHVGRVDFSLERLAAGAAAAGRSVDDVDVWHVVRIHVSGSMEQGIEEQGFYTARFMMNAFGSPEAMRVRGLVVPDELADGLEAFRREFDSSKAYEPGSTYGIDLLRRHGIAEWASREFIVTGTPDDVVRQLRALVDAGADSFLVPQMLPSYMETTREMCEVFSELRP